MKLKINGWELTGRPDELVTFVISYEMKENLKQQLKENLSNGDEDDGSV